MALASEKFLKKQVNRYAILPFSLISFIISFIHSAAPVKKKLLLRGIGLYKIQVYWDIVEVCDACMSNYTWVYIAYHETEMIMDGWHGENC